MNRKDTIVLVMFLLIGTTLIGAYAGTIGVNQLSGFTSGIGFTWLNSTNFAGTDVYTETIDAEEVFLNTINKTDILAFPELTASFIVFTDGSNYYAKNGTTGQIDSVGTNYTTVFQYAVDNCPVGGSINQLAGEYYPDNDIDLVSNITLVLGDSVMYWNVTGNEEGTLFFAEGSLGANTVLLSDAAQGDATLNVTDASIFSLDEWVRVSSTNDEGTGYKDGEIHKILSINLGDDTITLYTPIWLPYTVADTGTVTLINNLENIKIVGGTIIGYNNPGIVRGVRLLYTTNSRITEMTMINVDYNSIELPNSVYIEVDHNYITGATGAGGVDGIAVEATSAASQIDIHDNLIEFCRIGVRFGSPGAATGQPRDIRIYENRFINITLNAISANDLIRSDAIFIYNNFFNTPGISSIRADMLRVTIQDNVFINFLNAIVTQDYNEKILLVDNTFYYGDYALNLGSDDAVEIKIDGVTVLGELTGGTVYILGNGNGELDVSINSVHNLIPNNNYYGMFIDGAAKYVTVSNSEIANMGRSGIRIRDALGGLISGNEVYDNGVNSDWAGIHLSNCTNFVVQNNRLFDDKAAGKTQDDGLLEDDGSDNNVIKLNWLDGNQDDPMVIIGAGTITRDNFGYLEFGDIRNNAQEIEMYNGTAWRQIS